MRFKLVCDCVPQIFHYGGQMKDHLQRVAHSAKVAKWVMMMILQIAKRAMFLRCIWDVFAMILQKTTVKVDDSDVCTFLAWSNDSEWTWANSKREEVVVILELMVNNEMDVDEDVQAFQNLQMFSDGLVASHVKWRLVRYYVCSSGAPILRHRRQL